MSQSDLLAGRPEVELPAVEAADLARRHNAAMKLVRRGGWRPGQGDLLLSYVIWPSESIRQAERENR
jgi:hypothetical protein